MTDQQLDQLSINTIRTLSMDAVQQAKSGHPTMRCQFICSAYKPEQRAEIVFHFFTGGHR